MNTKVVDREMRKKDKSEEVTWLTKGLEGWGLEFGWRIRNTPSCRVRMWRR